MAELKNASTLLSWLKEQVAPRLTARTETMAHGGTALTLLTVKEYTKDVELSFRQREDFERFSDALRALGYAVTADSKARRDEHWLRFQRQDAPVDLVDLHFPLWNNWRPTPRILRKSLTLHVDRIDVLRPDVDVVFLFKTYPLRESDIDDLRKILDAAPPDEGEVIGLFEEQDKAHRDELFNDQTSYEPLFNILELRVRFAGSLDLIGPAHRSRIPRILGAARQRFRELNLRTPLRDLLVELRSEGHGPPISWDKVLGDRTESLRDRLAPPASRRGRA